MKWDGSATVKRYPNVMCTGQTLTNASHLPLFLPSLFPSSIYCPHSKGLQTPSSTNVQCMPWEGLWLFLLLLSPLISHARPSFGVAGHLLEQVLGPIKSIDMKQRPSMVQENTWKSAHRRCRGQDKVSWRLSSPLP